MAEIVPSLTFYSPFNINKDILLAPNFKFYEVRYCISLPCLWLARQLTIFVRLCLI